MLFAAPRADRRARSAAIEHRRERLIESEVSGARVSHASPYAPRNDQLRQLRGPLRPPPATPEFPVRAGTGRVADKTFEVQRMGSLLVDCGTGMAGGATW